MADNFHDIIPPERRSIRNVTASHSRGRRGSARADVGRSERPSDRPPEHPRKPRMNTNGFFSRFGLWLIAGATVVVFILVFSLLFSGTTITIAPKERDVTVDGSFESKRTAATDGSLVHEIMTIERTAERLVPATGEQDVEERASGTIVIFNDFNTSEQRLITNTRFETPDGLIYRIDEPIVVPGQQTEGGETIPGSVEVAVYADEPGERYNIGLTDFTIPGFKGSQRFDHFFARSKTPMTGGFIGTKLVADKSDVEDARAGLRNELERELAEQSQFEVPEGFHLLPGASSVTYESLPDRGEDDTVGINEKAILHGIIYRADDLSRFIAAQTVAGYDNEPVLIKDPQSLSYTLADETLRPWEIDEVQFTLRGNATLVWQYDAEALKDDLAGRSKDALPTILSGYPSIREANVSIRPFWRRTFPSDSEDITIQKVAE